MNARRLGFLCAVGFLAIGFVLPQIVGAQSGKPRPPHKGEMSNPLPKLEQSTATPVSASQVSASADAQKTVPAATKDQSADGSAKAIKDLTEQVQGLRQEIQFLKKQSTSSPAQPAGPKRRPL
jgi:hypothetical protein